MELDNSKRSTFVTCPRKYYYSYIKNFQGVIGSAALRYGTAFHAGMEAYYEYIRLHGWTRDGKAIEAALLNAKKSFEEETALFSSFWEDFRTLPNLLAALVQYFNFFAGDEGFLQVVSPERAFKIEITDEKTGITFFFTGKIDLEVKLNGRIWGMEFKTSGYPIVTQTKNIQWSPQILGYSYALGQLNKGEIPDGYLTMLHQISARKVKSGDYGKLKIDFSRPPQIFSLEDLQDWREMFVFNAFSIMEATAKGQFVKQRDNCKRYGQCGFWRLCEQGVPLGEENTDGFQVRKIPWDVLKTVKKENIIEAKEEVVG